MSYESPHNSFRASIGREPGASPVVSAKKALVDPCAEGLAAVAVPRAEARCTNHRDGERQRLTDAHALVQFRRKKHQVDLINLSDGGAMVEGAFEAKLWDKLELFLEDSGAVECVVRWVRGNRFGLEFAHETRNRMRPGNDGRRAERRHPQQLPGA